MTKKINVTTTVLLSVLTVVLFQLSGKTNEVRAAEGQDRTESQVQRPHGDDDNMPNGVIGVSLQLERNVSAIRLRCMWPMCIRWVLHNKQVYSTEMKS